MEVLLAGVELDVGLVVLGVEVPEVEDLGVEVEGVEDLEVEEEDFTSCLMSNLALF